MGRGLWVDCALADGVGSGRGMGAAAVVGVDESEVCSVVAVVLGVVAADEEVREEGWSG